MPMINCKVTLESTWGEKYISSSAGSSAAFKITSVILYIPIVTLLTKDNVKQAKQLSDGFKGSVFF